MTTCPWCGATRRAAFEVCPDSCGWSVAGHPGALAAVEVGGAHVAATGANPLRAREFLGRALRAAQLDQTLAADATVIDAPDVGPWSFRWAGGQYVDVSRPGAAGVDVVDMWDDFDFDWMQTANSAEFLRLCRRWIVDWADKFERDGE